MESKSARLLVVVFGFDTGRDCGLLVGGDLFVGFWSDNAAANRPSSVIPCCSFFIGTRAGGCGGSGAILENNLSISDIDVVALVDCGRLSCLCVIETLALVTTTV